MAWERWFKTFVRKTRFFKVSTLQDKLDALSIYGGGEEVETLIETLPDPDDGDVTLPADVKPANEPVNEYHRQAYKLNEHFKTMVNKDSARSKFDCMTQGSRTVAQYFVELRKQADRCQFVDRDDSIRNKILQTMNDKQLRREAMLKCLPLDKLLKRADNKEDVERQAREMEKNARDDVNRVYEQRKPKKKPARFHAKPPHTPETKPPHSGHAGTQCKYCGYSHGGQRSMCPAAGQLCNFCKKKGHFARVCLAKNTSGNDSRRHHAHQLGQFASTENTSDSDYVFSLPKSEAARPTVKVTINGSRAEWMLIHAHRQISWILISTTQSQRPVKCLCSYNQRIICCTHTLKHRP